MAERSGSAVGATKVEVASELYAAFDFKSAAAGELDSLFHRLAVPDLEVEPPPIYPDMRIYRGLDGWHVWTFREGKVARIHTVMDESEARKVAGLSDLQSPG